MRVTSKFVAVLGLAGCLFSVCSCSPDDKPQNNNAITEEMSPAECKEYIQSTCIEAVEMINPSDFQPVADFVKDLDDVIDKLNPDKTTLQWLMTALNNVYVSDFEEDGNVYRYLEEFTVSLAPFSGHFTLKEDGTFTRKEAKDLMVEFTKGSTRYELSLDKSDKLCEFTLKEDVDNVHDYGYGSDVYNGFVKVSLPEEFSLTLKKNGSKLAGVSIKLKADIKSTIIYNDVVNAAALKSANAVASVIVDVAGYSVSLNNVSYANQKASAAVSLSKGKVAIVSINATLEGVDYVDSGNESSVIVNKADFKVDVLNKIQVKGNAFVTQLISNIGNADEYYTDEQKVKAAVAKANDCMDCGLYFSSDVRQAKIELSAVNDYEDEWTYEPVLVFGEGGPAMTYSFEEFFDSTSFANLIAAVQSLAEEFADMDPFVKEIVAYQ